MEVRPGYKQTEVGAIPEGWAVKLLGDLFEVTSSKRVFQSEWRTNGVPFYRARELAVLGETGFVDNELFITREMYEEFKGRHGVPATGDMLVTGVGTLGKTYVVSGEHEFYFKDGNIIWFKIGLSLSSEFLRQLYLTPLIIKQIGSGSAGTTVGTYTITAAKKTTIPFPPLPEQRAIATALSDVDALLGGLDRLIAKKRDLKQAAMQQLLTGQTRIPGFHSEWEAVEFGDIATIRNTKVVASATPSGTQCVELESIGQGSGRLLMSTDATGSASKYSFKKGDVLFGRLRAYLRKYWLATFDGICSTEIWPLIARDERLCGDFLHLLVQANDFVNAAGVSYGTHMPRSDWSVLEKFPVRLPPFPEQTAIAAVLSDMDAELSALEVRRGKTRDLKQGMMQELLTGKTLLVPAGAAHA